MLLESTITCPKCSFEKVEVILENTCQAYHRCPNCQYQLKVKDGDCCVFCSYGSMPCPNAQFVGSSCCSRD